MKLMMYPETDYEKLKVRFGVEGIEPSYILQNLGRDNPNYTILTIVINVLYPEEVIIGGRYLNPRILRMFDQCLDKLKLCLVPLGHYPKANRHETFQSFLPVFKCEWVNNSRWYLLIDQKGNKQGELKFWDMADYYGDFYGEDAAIFVASSKEQNLELKALLEQHCKQEHIGFTEYPDVQYKKVPRSFGERIFASLSNVLKSRHQ